MPDNDYYDDEQPVFMTSKEWAKANGLTHAQVNNLLRQGKITGIQRGRDWLIPVVEGSNPRFLTAKRFAEKFDFSHSHVRWMLRNRIIPGEKIGRDWIISDGDFIVNNLHQRRRHDR